MENLGSPYLQEPLEVDISAGHTESGWLALTWEFRNVTASITIRLSMLLGLLPLHGRLQFLSSIPDQDPKMRV